MLIRAVVQDDPAQSLAAVKALRSASLIAVTAPALCEFVWVLARGYKRSPSEIAAAIRSLLATDTVVADRPAVETGLAFMGAGADFADGIIAYQGAQLGAETFLSFDAAARAAAKKSGLTAAAPAGTAARGRAGS